MTSGVNVNSSPARGAQLRRAGHQAGRRLPCVIVGRLRPDRALVTYTHAERNQAQLHKDGSGRWLSAKRGSFRSLYWTIVFLAVASLVTALDYEESIAVVAGIGQGLLMVLFVILTIYGVVRAGRS